MVAGSSHPFRPFLLVCSLCFLSQVEYFQFSIPVPDQVAELAVVEGALLRGARCEHCMVQITGPASDDSGAGLGSIKQGSSAVHLAAFDGF